MLPFAVDVPGIALRRATREDLAFFRQLYGGSRAFELALTPWSPEQKQAFLDDQFRLQHLHFTRVFARADFLVVTQAALLTTPREVGRLYLDRSTPKWRIVEIGLLPELHGGGIGTALLEAIKAAAANAGAEGVTLQVAQHNPRARALYLRLGFVDDGAPEISYQPMVWRAGA